MDMKASSATRMMSQTRASTQPAPIAAPFMAAITGLPHSITQSKPARTSSASCSVSKMRVTSSRKAPFCAFTGGPSIMTVATPSATSIRKAVRPSITA